MRDWASSGGVKVDRAIEHINYLEREIAAFKERGGYSTFRDDDPQTGDLVHRARVLEQPPPRWGAIAGDAIHNLRSALDILWRRLMYPDGGGETNFKIAFNIYGSPEAFKRSNSREIKSRNKAAVEIYRTLKPYKGGNDNLWRLSVLDDADKHRLLIPVGLAIVDTRIRLEFNQFVDFSEASMDMAHNALSGTALRYPIYDGAELYRLEAHARSKVDMNPQITFDIAFGEAGVAEGEPMPIVPTLSELLGVVEGVIKAFDIAGLLDPAHDPPPTLRLLP